MTPAQQAAKEAYKQYINSNGSLKQWIDLDMPPGKSGESYASFIGGYLTGYEAAEGSFGEWASENGWVYISGQGWYKIKTMISGVSTTEVIAIWKKETKQ